MKNSLEWLLVDSSKLQDQRNRGTHSTVHITYSLHCRNVASHCFLGGAKTQIWGGAAAYIIVAK